MLAWMARKRGVRFLRRAATSTQMHARVHPVQTSLRMHMRNRRHSSYLFYFAVENRDLLTGVAERSQPENFGFLVHIY
jgi:hypothetical protein